ncbi:MAG TPA: YdcF family protein [Variovorax sp.]|nr:YdcF family protein [Variovorax sp.]
MKLRGKARRRMAIAAVGACALPVVGLMLLLAREQALALAQAPARPAQFALVLGNRAYIDGQPNPCLTSRVDRALVLAHAGLAGGLLMSGGMDDEDGRIEAEVMAAHARAAGFGGTVLLERNSRSTRENLLLSLPVLRTNGARSVIIVTDARHLWRVRLLARASGFDSALDVQYAASRTDCSNSALRQWRAALREPLAIINNAFHGYL